MTKIYNIVFILGIAMCFAACGSDQKAAEQTSDAKPEPTFKMNDKSDKSSSTKVNDGKTTASSRPITDADRKKVEANSMKTGQSYSDGSTSGTITNDPSKIDPNAKVPPTPIQIMNSIPDACDLISAADVERIFGLGSGIVNQKDASTMKSPYTKSCFYRWDGVVPNTGILVQVQGNPVPEEFEGWVSLFVSSKRTSGEKSMATNETFKYKKLEGLGDDGSYSHRLGKYVWRIADDYVFTISFNTNSAPDVQMKHAQAIGKVMMENYKG